MSEYGPGMTIGRAAELDKERVRHALMGELICGEDDRGFVYEPASREECERYILGVVDHWVYQAKQLADSGRAMERVMEAHGFSVANHMREYIDAMADASSEYDDYVYEADLDELYEQANELLGGDCS